MEEICLARLYKIMVADGITLGVNYTLSIDRVDSIYFMYMLHYMAL